MFFRRRDLFFADHAIFALHYHSFWFSIFTLSQLGLPKNMNAGLLFILMAVAAYYFVAALRNAYKIGWGRSVITTFVVGIIYALLLAAAFFASLLIIIAAA